MILAHYLLKELGTPFSGQNLIGHFFSFWWRWGDSPENIPSSLLI